MAVLHVGVLRQEAYRPREYYPQPRMVMVRGVCEVTMTGIIFALVLFVLSAAFIWWAKGGNEENW